MYLRDCAHDDSGFGLVELMVTVIIVGVLSAVAVPIFLGQSALAQDAAVRSDLAATKTAFVSMVTLDSERTERNLRNFGQAIAPETSSFEININESALASDLSDWWRLQETSATGSSFHVTYQGTIVEEACDDFYDLSYFADGHFH